MDGENNGTPYEQMDDLGGKPPYFWKHPDGATLMFQVLPFLFWHGFWLARMM